MEIHFELQVLSIWGHVYIIGIIFGTADYGLYLKIASVMWPNMQGSGHAAIVNYCKCPITQQIRPQGVPGGFACFEFFLTHRFDEFI